MAGRAKLTIEQVRGFVKENSDCELISDVYIKSKADLTFRCGCGKEFTTHFDRFKSLNKRSCNDCGHRRIATARTIPAEVFEKRFSEQVGDEYEALTPYVAAKIDIKVVHKKCGLIYDVSPDSVLRGSRCPICVGKNRPMDTEDYKKRVFDLVGDEYTVLGNYKKSGIGVALRHNLCGHVYSPRPNSFIMGRRCPMCSESRGEQAVKEVLDLMDLSYKREYSFKDLRVIRPLKFDFAVFADNEITLIEYDGEFHFKERPMNQGIEGLLEQQKRDQMKNDYCNRNNIRLIRIPYWEFDNIETILKDALL